MDYNSSRGELVISEYGRNIQKMIYTMRTIEDPEKRQQVAEAIVELMHQMNPNDRNNPDYKEKLWRHLFRIANYDLDVKPPHGEKPTPESNRINPEQLEYPAGVRKNRHYGKYVQQLIKKAVEMEAGEKRDEFVMIIACYMKLAYGTWNREYLVSDEVIKQDLHSMSGKVLSLKEEDTIDVKIPHNNRNVNRGRSNRGRSSGRNSGRNNRNRNNNNNRRRR